MRRDSKNKTVKDDKTFESLAINPYVFSPPNVKPSACKIEQSSIGSVITCFFISVCMFMFECEFQSIVFELCVFMFFIIPLTQSDKIGINLRSWDH